MAVTFVNWQWDQATQRYKEVANPKIDIIFPEGTVLSVEDYYYHVPSDNAMIDSGNGRRVKAFVNGRVVTREFREGRGMAGYYEMNVDATDDVREQAKEWGMWMAWFSSLRSTDWRNEKAREKAKEVSEGKRVRVVRGRKVPKGGVWFVHVAGSGNYGPYVHLSSEPRGMGDYHRYVNPDNLEVIASDPDPIPYDPCPVRDDGRLLTLALAWNKMTSGYKRAYYSPEELEQRDCTLMAMADALEELGHDPSVFRRAVQLVGSK